MQNDINCYILLILHTYMKQVFIVIMRLSLLNIYYPLHDYIPITKKIRLDLFAERRRVKWTIFK